MTEGDMQWSDQVPLTRNEIVAITKAVLGEVHSADRWGHLSVRCYRGTRALEIQFTLRGSITRSYMMPFPPEVLDLIDDPNSNPYDSIDCTVRPIQSEPAPPLEQPLAAAKETEP